MDPGSGHKTSAVDSVDPDSGHKVLAVDSVDPGKEWTPEWDHCKQRPELHLCKEPTPGSVHGKDCNPGSVHMKPYRGFDIDRVLVSGSNFQSLYKSAVEHKAPHLVDKWGLGIVLAQSFRCRVGTVGPYIGVA